VDRAEKVFGKIGRITVGSILVLFFLFIISVVLREFSEDMKIIALTDSPISFVSVFFLLGMIAGAYMGLEAIVRFGAVAVPIIAIGYAVIAIGTSQYYDFSRMMPLFGTGTYDIFIKGLKFLSIFSGIITLFMTAPYIRTYKDFKSAGYAGLGISSAILVSSTIVYMLTYPYPTAVENFLPVFEMARLVNYGRLFQRIESLFLILWATAALLYLSMGFFFIVFMFKKAFKLEYYRPLIMPFAIIIFNLSLLPPNLITAIDLETNLFRTYAWIIAFVMTIVLLVFARFLKRNDKKDGKKNEAE
jgi:spore germination protein (amino acid permease)